MQGDTASETKEVVEVAHLLAEADFLGTEYRFKQKTLVLISSTTNPTNAKVFSLNKRTARDVDEIDRDVDTIHLIELFEERVKARQVEIKTLQDETNTYENFVNYVQSKALKEFDTFLFVFLTYCFSDDMLHFNDRRVPMDDILTAVKKSPYVGAKPKVFLMQADCPPGTVRAQAKGFRDTCITETVKLPTDSDIITIMCKLPGVKTPNLGMRPSLLIQAFADEMKENWRRTSDDRLDFLSLTAVINNRFKDMLGDLDQPLPMVSSTLRQLLYL